MTIQWFPGHMAKARREIEEKLKLVDFVIELVDARVPLSSQNPMLQEILKDKPKINVPMTKDLADPRETKKSIHHFEENQVKAIAVNVNDKSDISKVIQFGKELGQVKLNQLIKKGIKPRPARAMIIGIPNVGKSTLINRLANKKIAATGDRPGVTKQQVWIKVKNEFDLLDTPGILWPKFEDQAIGYRLAAIGTIKDHLVSMQDVVAYVINYLRKYYPDVLNKRYDISSLIDDMWEIFESIGKKRGALESGGNVNFDKVAHIVIRDLRTGKLGRITLELRSEERRVGKKR